MFDDRLSAGRILARKLADSNFENRPLVLALPRGGVPVAFEVARRLKFPLDVLIVKKISLPQNPEVAIGAIAEDGEVWVDQSFIRRLGISQSLLEQTIKQRSDELKSLAVQFRAQLPPQPLEGRHVIVVDDGLATGATMASVVRLLRQKKVARVTVAVPVSSKEAAANIAAMVDEFVCLSVPTSFYAVGAHYRSFPQLSTEEALRYFEPGLKEFEIPIGQISLWAHLKVPERPRAIVVFVHGSGSSRFSPRNQAVAKALNAQGFATLLFDLLTDEEFNDRNNVFDILKLSSRLERVTTWVEQRYPDLPIVYFGASTGAAAAIDAAALKPQNLFAVVSRGGRVDLAKHPDQVDVPCLLIVGSLDEAVLDLNRTTAEKIKDSAINVVEGAGHLFEEPGMLDEVVDAVSQWLDRKLAPQISMGDEIKRLARPIGLEGLREFARSLAEHRIVMLGEATHGTQEFYELRRQISQFLIADHGFKTIAVEGDWPDCYKLNKYIFSGEGENARSIMAGFRRWPQWMWANTEVMRLVEWMKRSHRAEFFGLDIYSLFESIDAIRLYADKLNPDLATALLQRYSCFDPYLRSEIAYLKSLARFPEGCKSEIIANLRELLSARAESINVSESDLFDLRQNARIIANAEGYYRSLMEDAEDNWNIREEHMMETLKAVSRRGRGDSKIIVWAHNTHVGDYHATDMIERGEVSLGGLVRAEFGRENVCLVGFGTYEGEVLAGRAWGAEAAVMPLPPVQEDSSVEQHFHQAATALGEAKFACLFDEASRHGPLSANLRQRAVGVVYRPEFEHGGRNSVPTTLSERYDAFIFVDRTHALHSIRSELQRHVLPETWPQGQ